MRLKKLVGGWPSPNTAIGALLYAIIGGVATWVIVDFLPRHLIFAVGWR
ncbi:hypothetical protein [Actinomadura oligospora]|nr:hypothetical protein [Actinomadura oligospora]